MMKAKNVQFSFFSIKKIRIKMVNLNIWNIAKKERF